MQMYGKFQGFPMNNALFGLVIEKRNPDWSYHPFWDILDEDFQ